MRGRAGSGPSLTSWEGSPTPAVPPRVPQAALPTLHAAGTHLRARQAAEAPTRTVAQGWRARLPEEDPESLRAETRGATPPLPYQGRCRPAARCPVFTQERLRVPGAWPFPTAPMGSPGLRPLPSHRVATTRGQRPSVTCGRLSVRRAHPWAWAEQALGRGATGHRKHPTCQESWEPGPGFGSVVRGFHRVL